MAFGDELFSALQDVEGVNLQDLQQARELGNQLSASAGSVASWMRTDGTMSPNLFAQRGPGGGFTMLPHESVSIMRAAASQAINSESATIITFEDDATVLGESEAYSRLLWQHGIDANRAAGEILLRGVPEETVWLISYEIVWANAIQAFVTVVEKDTAEGLTHSFDDNDATYLIQNGCFMMQARKAAASWQLSVFHSEGVAKNVDFALFQATRLR